MYKHSYLTPNVTTSICQKPSVLAGTGGFGAARSQDPNMSMGPQYGWFISWKMMENAIYKWTMTGG